MKKFFIHDIQKFMVLVKLFLPTYQENLARKKMSLKIGILVQEALKIYGVVKLKEFPEVNFTGWG